LELVTQMIEADLFALNYQYQGGLCWPAGTPYFQVPKPGSRSQPTKRVRSGKRK
jgi:hypothetical protein